MIKMFKRLVIISMCTAFLVGCAKEVSITDVRNDYAVGAISIIEHIEKNMETGDVYSVDRDMIKEFIEKHKKGMTKKEQKISANLYDILIAINSLKTSKSGNETSDLVRTYMIEMKETKEMLEME